MRIALVSQEYPPETAHGGIGTQNHAKAHGLAARGHQMHVISHSTDEQRHEYSDGLVHVTRIPGFDKHLPLATEEARWITYSAQVAAAVATLHARQPLDLVEFPDWGCEGYVHLLNRTEWNSIPTAIHLHGPIVMFANAIGWPPTDSDFYHVARHMEETSLRLAAAVFSSSHCSAKWCADHYGLELNRIPVLHTGIDTSVFRPAPTRDASRPTIVFVGKIAANKGIDLLVDVACRLAAEFPDLRLQILGRGNDDLVKQLRDRACHAGFPELLDFRGFVEHHELPRYLSQADVFAVPSEYEGGPGFVYLEAMACGIPVVACRGSGADEAIIDGVTGRLVPPRDHDALLSVLRQLLGDRNQREEMGTRAAEYVRREADSQLCIKRIESFYRDVVRRHSDQYHNPTSPKLSGDPIPHQIMATAESHEEAI